MAHKQSQFSSERQIRPELFRIKEAAVFLNVSDSSVRRLIARGELKAIRKLRHILISRAELEKFSKDAE